MDTKKTARLRRLTAMLTASAMLAVGVVALGGFAASAAGGPAPIEQRSASTVTADPLPTVQIDSGVVWAQVINGNTVYAGGSFSNARPAGAAAGTNLMPRSNILAYDINTGVATSFAPNINGTVKALALSPDGSRLYVGGSFSQVNGIARFNFAAFDTATGALLTTYKPAIGGSYVNAIVATNSTVYVGGLIGAAGGITRKNLAAVSATNGAVLGWAPTTDLQVDSMVLAPQGDKLVIAGRFEHVNDVTSRGMGALDLTTGALVPWAATAIIKNGLASGSLAGRAGIWNISSDATGGVYGTAWVYSNTTVGNLEGLFALNGSDGSIKWIADCHGDHYGIYSDGINVYSTGHEHDCVTAGGYPQANPAPGNMRNATAYTAAAKGTLTRSPSVGSIYSDWSGYPAPAAINWYPDWTTGSFTGQGQAGWTATGNGTYLLVGGEFPYVNGQRSQGIARFSNHPSTGAKQGPMVDGADWTPTFKSVSAGTVRVSIAANWDRDDLNLFYELWEVGGTAPVATATGQSSFWNRPTVTMTVRGLAANSAHSYYVVAKDADGNSGSSAPVDTTVSSAPQSDYADGVLNDGAGLLWRLGGTDGGADWAGSNNAVFLSGVGTTTDDALASEANGSATFTGTTSGVARTGTAQPAPASFATELWFKTNTTTGGKLAGYGSSASGASSSYDRHVYMRNTGQIIFGVYPGAVKTVQSPLSYNDNQWHHLVAQLSSTDGVQLYIDAKLVASDATTISAQAYTGYWRLGGDNLGSWPNRPTSDYFKGSIDEFAVYGQTLTAAQISAHYAIAKGTAAPTAKISVSGGDLTWSFDGSGSTVPPGRTIQSYAWAFGDGQTAAGPTATHAYDVAGTYQATLTVTDNLGLKGVASTTVTAVAPHSAPVASFTSNVGGLTVGFDGGGSSASGGATISSYAWTFGDGTTGTGSAPSHKYASAGTYPVTLTVTDSMGAVSPAASSSVTVAHSNPVASFTSQVSGLSVAFSSTGSSASDGATLAYDWNFGDGSTSSQPSPTHLYASAGTYQVSLTVTDSLGAVSAPAAASVVATSVAFIAQDDFERTVASGWGSAVVGGAWGTTAGFSVAGGVGSISVAAGQTRTNALTSVSAQDADVRFQFATDRVANGGGVQFNFAAHKSTAGEYRVKLKIASTGVVNVSVAKLVGATETVLLGQNLAGYTHTAGSKLQVRFQLVTAGGSTTLRAKVWVDGAAEPSAWNVSTSDTQAELQGAGQVGLSAYTSGSATNGPVIVSIDNLDIR